MIKQQEKCKDISILAILSIIYYALAFPTGLAYPIGLLLTVAMFVFERKGKIIYRSSIILITLFVVTYFLFEGVIKYSFMKSLIFAVTLIVMYVFGLNWAKNNDEYEEILDKTKEALMIIYYCLSIYIILCGIYTLVSGYAINAAQRNLYIFWNGQMGNTTHFGSLSTVPLAIAVFLSMRRNGVQKVLHIIIATALLTFNMLMANRIIFVYLVVFLLIALLCNNRGKGANFKIKTIVSLLTIVLIFSMIYMFNVFNVQSFVSSIPVFQRISTLNTSGYEDPRLERQIYIVLHMFDHLSGGGWFTDRIGESHNVWLDIFDYSGVIPFILFLIFTIMCIKQIFYCYKKCNKNETYALLTLTICAYMVAFAVEPVFRSCEEFFCLFFFCTGMLNRIRGGI